MAFSEFQKETWLKNWVGNWGMLFLSWYGSIYTRTYEESLGKRMHNALFCYERAAATNYLAKSELNELCTYLSKKLASDEKVADEWCSDLRARTDRMMGLLGHLERKADFGLRDLIDLSECMHAQNPPNFAIKKVADYLPPELLNKHLHDFKEARLYCEPVYNRTEAVISKWNKLIGKREKIPSELIRCMIHEEMVKYLAEGALPGKKILLERDRGSMMWYSNGNVKIFTGIGAIKIRGILTKPSKSEEVTGMAAYTGKATGIARIIFDPLKVKRFNPGDVLITGMTRPEFLPLMKKSSAFVTDAGGMLCHAAIVARELMKPCIVGTENATKVFKDGDRVEVDAANGVVRKMK
ncbi:MAG: PEP-utilizing enzyme [Candidatus Micrarchaeota archaeon]